MYIWDLREKKPVGNFDAPHISGDSLDYKSKKILVGGYMGKNNLKIYDFKTMKVLQVLNPEE